MRTFLLVTFWSLTSVLQAQATLTVEVTLNKPAAGGMVRTALCPSSQAFTAEKGCKVGQVNADGTTVEVHFEEVLDGEYAVKVFHDVNNNGKLDTNWMGVPKEPYGFSNDAMGTFGPPSWEQARFTVKGHTLIRIRSKG